VRTPQGASPLSGVAGLDLHDTLWYSHTVSVVTRVRSYSSRRAFSLAELVITIIVLAVLAAFAMMAFRAVVGRSQEGRQQVRTLALLREAKTIYAQKTYQDPTYTWQNAIIDASADLPEYKSGAFSDNPAEGASATGGTNLNTAANSWTLELDTGSTVFSTAPSELVFKVQNGVLYVASATSDAPTGRGVFGSVSQITSPMVWSALCTTSACDAESATNGPPASGSYP
jgi:prepilin-type N-terminal cleavage/methylation domain-containing protein